MVNNSQITTNERANKNTGKEQPNEMSFTDHTQSHVQRYFSLKLLFNDVYAEMMFMKWKNVRHRDDKYWDDEKSRNISHRRTAAAVYIWIMSVIVVCFTGISNYQTESTAHTVGRLGLVWLGLVAYSLNVPICRVRYHHMRINCVTEATQQMYSIEFGQFTGEKSQVSI